MNPEQHGITSMSETLDANRSSNTSSLSVSALMPPRGHPQSSALHPVAWLTWAAACTLVVATTRNPLYVLLVTLCAGAAYRAGRGLRPSATGAAQWSLVLRAAWTLTSVAVLFNALTVHAGDRALVTVPRDLPLVGTVIGGPLTLNALLYGVVAALALGTVILIFAALNTAVGYEDLLRLLPRPLTGLGVTMTVALGFLPQTIAALGAVREAQMVRGHTVRRGLRDLPPLVVPVLALGLERAIMLAEAMAARGFGVPGADGARIRRTAYRARSWRPVDMIVAAGALISALLVVMAAVRDGALIWYPYPILHWPPFDLIIGAALIPLLLPALVLSYTMQLPPAPIATTAGSDRDLMASETYAEAIPHSPAPVKRVRKDRPEPLARLSHVTYAYPHTVPLVLDDLSWDMLEMQAVLLLGPSGAGKSTLLRTFNGLVPHFSGGRFGGTVTVAGRAAQRDGPRAMSAVVGMLFQDPESAAVAPRVADDVAFALEQFGVPRREMRCRVHDALVAVGVGHLAERELATLSGGEQQRVALAAAIVRAPRLLVLDEPTSQLDPEGARAVLDAVTAVRAASGTGIILAEHRVERVVEWASEGLFLPGDGALLRGDLRTILARAHARSASWLPPVVALGLARGWHPLPLSIAEAKAHMARDGLALLDPPAVPAWHPAGAPLLTASGLGVSLDGQRILREIDLALYPGEIVALIGPNGAGKTTLLRALLGVQPLDAGRIQRAGHVGYVPQQPGALLFAEKVADELTFTLRARGLHTFPARYGDAEGLLAALRLDGMAGRYPRDLSVGERARVAIAAALAADPPMLFLDEPTRGLDPDAKDDLLAVLGRLRDDGQAVLLVTHDAELVARAADRVIALDRGRIVAEGHPRAVLPGTPFAPQINMLFGGTFLTLADARAALPRHGVVEV